MGQSYLLACATAGMHVRIGAPADYAPSTEVVTDAAIIAASTGGSVSVMVDPVAAVAGVDIVAWA